MPGHVEHRAGWRAPNVGDWFVAIDAAKKEAPDFSGASLFSSYRFD
jgi:hypothetical protein